eukprot:Selendium_serpulae@DN8139_c0_g1_i1.p1
MCRSGFVIMKVVLLPVSLFLVYCSFSLSTTEILHNNRGLLVGITPSIWNIYHSDRDPVPLQYIPPPAANVTTVGKRFNVDPRYFETLELPWNDFVPLDMEHLKDFVIITYASSNHCILAREAVRSGQQNHTIR